MKAAERGMLIGLVVVLALACGFIYWKVGRQDDGAGGVSTRRVPAAGSILKEWTTPGGVTVKVVAEGVGEPVKKGEAMDVAYTGYLATSGALFQRHVYPNLVLEDGGVIPGWIEGLQGMRRLEKRRLLVPAAMGYGDVRVGNITPNSDLVFDVQWAVLDKLDLVEGSGDEAREGARITVHYTGRLENGKMFDSSVGGDPISFQLRRGGLIDGWVLGVPGMRVGGKRKLFVPWHLAYKDRSRPPSGKPGMVGIPAYANLLFEIELIAVK